MADAMHEATLDARQEGGFYRRIEVITGQRRRRQWANISEVARRHGVIRGLLTVWRHKLGKAQHRRTAQVP